MKISTEFTESKCPSCNRFMYLAVTEMIVEAGLGVTEKKYTEQQNLESEHDVDRCRVINKRKENTKLIGYRVINIEIPNQTCWNCKYNEISDDMMMCGNEKNSGTGVWGFHFDVADMINTPGVLNLPTCDNWEGIV